MMEPVQVDMTQWEPFGAGNQGESYINRDDGSLMLKLYAEGTGPEPVTEEILRATVVERAGIPSPGPGVFARCGDRYGVIFKYIMNKKSFCTAVADDPGCLREMAVRMAAMVRGLHSMPSSGTGLPSVVETYRRIVRTVPVDADLAGPVMRDLEIVAAADRETLVHGDMHFGNLITDGERDYFIDLGAAGYGNPDLDNSLFFAICHMIPEERVFQDYHISKAQALEFWTVYKEHYYGAGAPSDGELADRFRPYLLLHTLRVQEHCGRSPMNDALMRRLAGV